MKILVTGGAGFIGSHIIDALLKQGNQMAVIDDLSSGSKSNLPEGVTFFEADICDRDAVLKAFAEFKPNRVCHQAAQLSVSRSVREPAFDAQVNVSGLLNVLDAAVENNADRFVFASSGGVLYGDVTEPAPEETPANPISPYGITKWVGERYLQFYSNEHNLDTVALRYSNVYGPRQNPHGEAGVVAIFNTLMLQGNSVKVNGDGKYIRDYVYAGDVARANAIALTADLPEKFCPYNIGTGHPTDVNELAEYLREEIQAVLKSIGSDKVIPSAEHGPERAGDLRSNLIDAAKIGKELNWKPEVTIKEGLAKTVEWFAKNAGVT